MIRLENVSKFYVNNNITSLGLININLELNKGEIVAIVGESGSGKSTLLNVITKVDKFDEGEIYYYGNETSYYDIETMDEFRKDKVGFIFQHYNILDSYTVLDNVMLPLLISGLDKHEAKEKAIELIKKVGLQDRIKSKGSKLSGGEKQRCVIARALAMSSEILACDEPTGNLDSETGKEIIQLIKEVAKDKLVLIVTHNYDLVKDIATRKIKVHDGRIVEDEKFVDVPKDEDKKENEVEIDFDNVKKSIDYKIASKFLTSTPKKTILSAFVFLFVCVFFLFLSASVNYAMKPKPVNDFVYKGNNKLIVYDPLKYLKLEDIEKISNNYVISPSYYTKSMQVELSGETDYMYYEDNPSNLKVVGEEADALDECVIIAPKYYKNKIANYKTVKFMNLSSDVGYINTFKVTGYQIRDDVNDICVTQNKLIRNYYNCDLASFLNVKISLTESTKFVNFDASILDYGSEEMSSSGIDLDKINYNSIPNEGTYNPLDVSSIVIGSDYDDYYNLDKISCVAVYGNMSDMKKTISSLGLEYIDAKTFTTLSEVEKTILKVTNYILIFTISLYLIGIYFLTYAILNKIYDSKIKDFAILRTLGIKSNDMKRIIRYDIMIQMAFMEVFVLILLFCLGKFVKVEALSVLTGIDLVIAIWYLVLMTGMGFLLARKIYKSLYQKTINQSLGGAKND